ncbi:hypothetical protein ACIA5D_27785 [Actinoplanes sp. NPDC051513]|uniref:hypothetical protein n=1 Tax=Actinoplanes sp. NPDC051513 TaxID=3363908 RepID=UPI0037B3D7C0
MTLRRPYAHRLFFLFFGALFLTGAVALAGLMIGDGLGWCGWLFCGVSALVALGVGIHSQRYAVLPFRIDIDHLGWTVRTPTSTATCAGTRSPRWRSPTDRSGPRSCSSRRRPG